MVNDYLGAISEKSMEQFLFTRFGSCLDGVIKYYDENYGGYLFKVKLNSGIEYLPKERNNTLRIGKFGIVKDDSTSSFPRTLDNFEIAKTAPNFFKSYIEFIAAENGDRKLNNKTYVESFKEAYSLFLLLEKINKTREIEDAETRQKKFMAEIITDINEKGKNND